MHSIFERALDVHWMCIGCALDVHRSGSAAERQHRHCFFANAFSGASRSLSSFHQCVHMLGVLSQRGEHTGAQESNRSTILRKRWKIAKVKRS